MAWLAWLAWLARLTWLHVLRRLTVRLLGCAQSLHRRAVLTWALGRLRALRPLGTTLRRRAVRSRLPLALRLARHRLVELTWAGRRAELAGATLLPRLLSRRTVLSWRWAKLTLGRPVRALPWRRTELSGALLPLRRLLRSARPLAVRRLSLRPARHARRGTELALPRLGVRGLGPLALGWPESLWSGLTWPALRSLWALLTRLTLGYVRSLLVRLLRLSLPRIEARLHRLRRLLEASAWETGEPWYGRALNPCHTLRRYGATEPRTPDTRRTLRRGEAPARLR